MAKLGNANKISNEELEAKVDEFAKKLEILRVRYEQYFIGVEKTAPSVMRMDVVRIMRDLEQVQVKNTAIKFKIRQCIQKFTSYSTYWNRTLREIEDGRYKRHIDKAKRNQPIEVKKDRTVAEVHHVEKTQAVADEAEAFLASLGISGQPKEQPKPATQPEPKPQPSLEKLSASDARSGTNTGDTRAMLRSRRPTIVGSSMQPAIGSPAAPQAPTSAASGLRSPASGISPVPPDSLRQAVAPSAYSNAASAQPTASASAPRTPVQRKRAITIVQAVSVPVAAPNPAPQPAPAAPPASKPPLPKPPPLPTLNKKTNPAGLNPGLQVPTLNRKDP